MQQGAGSQQPPAASKPALDRVIDRYTIELLLKKHPDQKEAVAAWHAEAKVGGAALDVRDPTSVRVPAMHGRPRAPQPGARGCAHVAGAALLPHPAARAP